MKAIRLLPARYQVAVRRDPEFLLELARAYGDTLHLRFGPRHLLLLHDPAAIGQVLVAEHRLFTKGRAHERARDWLGDGILLSEGDQHLRDRRLLQPAFGPAAIGQYAPAIVTHARNWRARWRADTTRDIARDMHLLALAVIGEVTTGTDLSPLAEQIDAALLLLGDWFSGRTMPLHSVRDRLPLARQRATRQARSWLDETITRIIAERQRFPHDGADLLGRLLRSHHPRATTEWLRDQILTLWLAGRETIAAGLSWAWYLLARHPAAEAHLHAELDAEVADRLPDYGDLPRLRYTRMVFAEALRLYPPAWATNRRALAACQIGGHDLPAGTVVLISQYVLHRHERCYDAPESFVPERWEAIQHPAHSYLPFGAGPRRCLGEPLAWAEAVLVIATLAQRWRLRLPPGSRVELRGGTSLQPLGGLPMIVESRLERNVP